MQAPGEDEIMLALLIAGALAQTPPPETPYVRCLREGVPALEASRESAGDVARAAVSLCARHEPIVASEAAQAIIDEARASFEGLVILHVVRLRACRLTPGCRIADLPDPFGRPE